MKDNVIGAMLDIDLSNVPLDHQQQTIQEAKRKLLFELGREFMHNNNDGLVTSTVKGHIHHLEARVFIFTESQLQELLDHIVLETVAKMEQDNAKTSGTIITLS